MADDARLAAGADDARRTTTHAHSLAHTPASHIRLATISHPIQRAQHELTRAPVPSHAEPVLAVVGRHTSLTIATEAIDKVMKASEVV